SKFQTSPSPVPLPEKLPACPALRLVGALVIVLVGSVTVTGTVCEVIRPPVQAENGWKALAGMVVPFRVTARLFGSKVQLASTATLTVPLVPTAPSLGVGPMKRSGLGFGSPHAAGGCARIAPRATPRGTAFLNQLIARPSPPCGESPFSASFDLSQTLAPDVNGGCIVARDPQRSGISKWSDGVTSNSHDIVIGTDPVTYMAQYINRPPVAVSVATPPGGRARLSVQFRGSASADPDFTYSGDFGDGSNSTQAAPQHTYTTAGTYKATLTVTDQRNGVGTATVTVIASASG